MTFLEALRSHKGGLILLKSELFWYGGRGWDGTRGRVCLLMDSATADAVPSAVCHAIAAATLAADPDAPAACLLIDGRPHWIWIAPADVELL
jgi:hypothetical protein